MDILPNVVNGVVVGYVKIGPDGQLSPATEEDMIAQLSRLASGFQPAPNTQPLDDGNVFREEIKVAEVGKDKEEQNNPRLCGQTTVLGFRFRGGNVTPQCLRVDDPSTISLDFEPTNKFDPNAIKVLVAGNHVGYIARDQTRWIGELLRTHQQNPLKTRLRISPVEFYSASVLCDVNLIYL